MPNDQSVPTAPKHYANAVESTGPNAKMITAGDLRRLLRKSKKDGGVIIPDSTPLFATGDEEGNSKGRVWLVSFEEDKLWFIPAI